MNLTPDMADSGALLVRMIRPAGFTDTGEPIYPGDSDPAEPMARVRIPVGFDPVTGEPIYDDPFV